MILSLLSSCFGVYLVGLNFQLVVGLIMDSVEEKVDLEDLYKNDRK